MTSQRRLPDRRTTARLLLLAILLLVVADLMVADPIDPYLAPYPIALGSGQIPSGAHCTNVSGLEQAPD